MLLNIISCEHNNTQFVYSIMHYASRLKLIMTQMDIVYTLQQHAILTVIRYAGKGCRTVCCPVRSNWEGGSWSRAISSTPAHCTANVPMAV